MGNNSGISMLIYLSQSLPSIQTLIFLVFGIIGIIISGSAVVSYFQGGRGFSSAGGNKQLSLLMKMFAGSMCLSLPWVMDTTAGTFFSETDTLIVQAGVPFNTALQQAALMTIVNLLAIFGYIAGGNGLLTLANGPTNQQPGWVGKGIVLIISGALLTNIWLTVDYTARTFGMSALGTEYFRF